MMKNIAVFAAAAALTAASAFTAGAARADVKVVSHLTGGASPGETRAGDPLNHTSRLGETITTLYKGNKIRIETVSGTTRAPRVTLLDGDAHKIYTLRPADKSYSVRPLGDAASISRMGRMMSMMEIHTDADVTSLPQKRTIAGKMAHGYRYKATITMAYKAQPGAARADNPAARRLGTVLVTGEQWVVDLPNSPISITRHLERQGAPAMNAAASDLPGFAPLFAKFDKIKGLPVASEQTVTITGMMAAMMGGGASGGGRMPPGAPPRAAQTGFHFGTEATAITDAPLPASLFTLPAGYHRAPEPGVLPTSKGTP